MAQTTSAESAKPNTDSSRWTDEQESALLQAIVRWKPVGMHKHFRMIAIRDFMLNQGVISPEDPHTTTAGIWTKLQSLYDLDKLDEREDSIIDGTDDDSKGVTYWRDFELPREDFEELMWQRRLAPEGTQSPDMSRRGSTVADSDEPRSSPVSGTRSVRGGRGSGRRGGRLSRLQNELETEKSSRRTSKATSVADEDQVMEDADEEDDDGQDSEEEEEEEESSEPEEEERKVKMAGRGGRRGRGRRGRRR